MKNIKKRKPHHTADAKIKACKEHLENKIDQSQLAAEYGVSLKTISNWIRSYRNNELADPKKSFKKKSVDNGLLFPEDLEVFSLKDAAEILRIEMGELLGYCVRFGIKLFYPVGDDRLLISTGELGGASASLNSTPLFKLLRPKVHYLALSLEDNLSLLRQGFVRRVEFEGGFFFSEGGGVVGASPLRRLGGESFFVFVSGDHVITKWKIIPQEDYQEKYIKTNEVFILREHLVSLWSAEASSKEKRLPLDDEFVRHPNCSSLLVDIDQAAFELFSGNNSIRKSFFQDKSRVSSYLQEEYGHSKTYAEKFSEIIVAGGKNERLPGSYRTRGLQDLIDAWSDLCKGDVSEEQLEVEYHGWLIERRRPIPSDARLFFDCKVIAPDRLKFGLKRKRQSS